jgi:hypothetical protein
MAAFRRRRRSSTPIPMSYARRWVCRGRRRLLPLACRVHPRRAAPARPATRAARRGRDRSALAGEGHRHLNRRDLPDIPPLPAGCAAARRRRPPPRGRERIQPRRPPGADRAGTDRGTVAPLHMCVRASARGPHSRRPRRAPGRTGASEERQTGTSCWTSYLQLGGAGLKKGTTFRYVRRRKGGRHELALPHVPGPGLPDDRDPQPPSVGATRPARCRAPAALPALSAPSRRRGLQSRPDGLVKTPTADTRWMNSRMEVS